MESSLDDLTILDFTRILAGPLATMVLGDLGATVIKVERPGGDDTRAWGPPYTEAGASTYFEAVNRNKRSVTLDLRDPADLAHARELAASADVVVENFRPGVMARLGLDHETLEKVNPRIVYCSITAFGTGAGAPLPGYDLLVQAVGGLMSVTGQPEGEPQKVGVALVDVVAGLFAAVGILAALRHRERTGEGQRVEVDLLSSLLCALSNQSSAYTAGGVVAERMGNAHPSIAPYEVLATADGHLAIAVGNDKQFASLARALGRPEWSQDPRFVGNEARVAHRSELRALLESELKMGSAEYWAAHLSAASVPAGPVNDIAAAFDLAQALGLDPVVELERGDGTSVRLPRNPIKLSRSPVTYRHAPPTLGTQLDRDSRRQHEDVGVNPEAGEAGV